MKNEKALNKTGESILIADLDLEYFCHGNNFASIDDVRNVIENSGVTVASDMSDEEIMEVIWEEINEKLDGVELEKAIGYVAIDMLQLI